MVKKSDLVFFLLLMASKKPLNFRSLQWVAVSEARKKGKKSSQNVVDLTNKNKTKERKREKKKKYTQKYFSNHVHVSQ